MSNSFYRSYYWLFIYIAKTLILYRFVPRMIKFEVN